MKYNHIGGDQMTRQVYICIVFLPWIFFFGSIIVYTTWKAEMAQVRVRMPLAPLARRPSRSLRLPRSRYLAGDPRGLTPRSHQFSPPLRPQSSPNFVRGSFSLPETVAHTNRR